MPASSDARRKQAMAIKKPQLARVTALTKMVGASRFERPTTRTPSEYATRLRHAPILYALMTYFSSSKISRTSFLAVSMTASASCRPLPFNFFRAPDMVYPL